MIKTIINIAKEDNSISNEELISRVCKILIGYEKVITRSKYIPAGYTKPMSNYTIEVFNKVDPDSLERLKNSLGIDKLIVQTIIVQVDRV